MWTADHSITTVCQLLVATSHQSIVAMPLDASSGLVLAGIVNRVEVMVSPDGSKVEALQQQLNRRVVALLAAAARGGSASKSLLDRVCAEVTSCLVSQTV